MRERITKWSSAHKTDLHHNIYSHLIILWVCWNIISNLWYSFVHRSSIIAHSMFLNNSRKINTCLGMNIIAPTTFIHKNGQTFSHKKTKEESTTWHKLYSQAKAIDIMWFMNHSYRCMYCLIFVTDGRTVTNISNLQFDLV